MKPLGMDKNRVLVYEGDKVLYSGNEYKAYENEISGILLLVPYLKSINDLAVWNMWTRDAVPGEVEVVNVSDRTNYERYFADLCDRLKIWDYICQGVACSNCVANESLCNEGLVLDQWLKQPAVKL